jgi:hypothetical protein
MTNLNEIEKKLSEMIKNLDKDNFIFNFLLAYKFPKASINRLKKGDYNLSKEENQVIWSKKIFFYKIIDKKKEDCHDIIDEISKDPLVEKNKIRFIIVTDFEDFLSIDTKTNQTLDIKTTEIEKNVDFFLPFVGIEKVLNLNEAEADIKAADKLGKLYDLILKDNKELTILGKDKHGLNIFFNRILFCFYAEDSKIFKDALFTKSISSHTLEDGSDLANYLNNLFEVLNSKDRKNLPNYFASYPYVNGGLFKNKYKTPSFSKESRKILIECGSINWNFVNPDILGSMLQAVVSDNKREELGIHYTSVKNILKVIKPLFLDDLYDELNECLNDVKKLKNLLKKIYNIIVFDPACGSGNFLIISFKELCRIEIEIFKRLKENDQNEWLILRSGIQLTQFYGIEVDDYAHETAKLSFWIAQHQMNLAFDQIVGEAKPTLPLSPSANIYCKNALKCDWNKIVPHKDNQCIYIVGNPPYLGSSKQSKENKSDMSNVLKNFKSYKNLDYISCWFYLASKFIYNTDHKFSFVSTSSICQGEQVSMLWPNIINYNLEIFFAYKPFKWTNLAKGKAGVTCVIIGVQKKNNKKKIIYNEKDNTKFQAKHISPYILDIDPLIFIERTSKQISGLPEMIKGNQPTDGGNLILYEDEYKKVISENPGIEKYLKRYVGANELISGLKRWCIWIEESDKKIALENDYIKNKVNKVKNYRLNSDSSLTRVTKVPPYKFIQIQNSPANAIIIPSVTSNRRKYLTVDYVKNDTVINNLAFAIYKPELYLFGLLSSRMHMVWLEAVSGRFGEGFRYSSVLCYNTFYFPVLKEVQKKDIEEKCLNIISEREKFLDKNLSELYEPKTMPESLLNCHKSLDKTIEKYISGKSFSNDDDRLKFLFNEFQKLKKKDSLL